MVGGATSLHPLARMMRRWSRRRSLLAVDVFLGSISVLCVLEVGLGHALAGWSPLFVSVVVTSAAALTVRAAMTRSLKAPDVEFDSSASRFEIALGDSGFAALSGLGEDVLDRARLADALESLVAAPREHPLTLGLAGPWGSGKTTILNELASRLRRRGYVVVQFDAWNFREPAQVVDGYFRSLETALRDWAFLPGLRTTIGKLARGVSSAASDRLGRLTALVYPTTPTKTVNELRADISDALRSLDRPVIVIVDDLDRLDEAELIAALRSIRLIAELRLVHVIAYDRAEVARLLFPSDATGTRARDYMAKIINVELAMPVSARDRQVALLNFEMRGLWDALGPEEARQLEGKLRGGLLSAVLRLLPTPRDIKRVVAATAWMWDRLAPHVNLLDLFLLNLIQCRCPAVYDSIVARPEWFIRLRWGDDVELVARQAEHEAAAKNYADELRRESPDGEATIRILKEMFPGNGAFSRASTVVTAPEARRAHRIFHPDVFGRYFRLGLRRNEISESVVEQTLGRIRALGPGVARQEALSGFIRANGDEDQVRQIVDQWDIVHEDIKTADDAALTRDVVFGICGALTYIPGDPDELIAPRKVMSYEALGLIGTLSNASETEGLAVEIAETLDDFEFLGDLVFYAIDAEAQRRSEMFGKHVPDGARLRAILDRRMAERYREGDGPLTTATYGELVTAAYRVTPHSLDEFFVRDLRANPKRLSTLLKLAVGVGRAQTSGEYRVFRADLGSLDEHVDLQEVYGAVESAARGDWTDEDRALFDVLAEWVSEHCISDHGVAGDADGDAPTTPA